MPETKISLAPTDLQSFELDRANFARLEADIMATLNAAPYHMGVTAVDADYRSDQYHVGGAPSVELIITAPTQLDPAAVKAALR